MRSEVDPEIFLTYRAKDIQTQMSENPICVDIHGEIQYQIDSLKSHGFDQAPVLERGVVIGWLLTQDLIAKRDTMKCLNPLSQKDLISSDAPLNDLLQRLRNRQLVFLVGKDGIEGFAVPSDINRHVARSHLYLMISGLEIALSRILTSADIPTDKLVKIMGRNSKKKWRSDRNLNVDTHPVEYMSLPELALALKLLNEAFESMEIKKQTWDAFIKRLTTIRNFVAHSNRDSIRDFSIKDIVDCMDEAERYVRLLVTYKN